MKRKPINYVNNKEFLNLLKQYVADRNNAIENNLKKPRVPESIGAIFIAISTNLSNKYNFINYTFKEDMVGDGIVNAIEAVDSFDPEKSSQPFSYFTMVIWRAFLRRIQREKKMFSTKERLMFSVEHQIYELQENDTCDLNRDEAFLWYNQEY